MGCYVDTGNRDLPKMISSNMSPKQCFIAAANANYKYAALQAGSYCFAGNSFGRYGKRPLSECSTKCRNDGSRTCGAGWRNEVFKVVKKEVAVVYKPIVGESFIGCYVDTGNRDLER